MVVAVAAVVDGVSVAAVVVAAVGLVAAVAVTGYYRRPWLWLWLHCSGLLLEPALGPDNLPVLIG